MRKFAIITIVSLCIFLSLSSAQAIEVIYKATGTIDVYTEDLGVPFAWDEKTISLEMRIDSNKTPFSWNSRFAAYDADNATLNIDGIGHTVSQPLLVFWKGETSADDDLFKMNLNIDDTWRYLINLELDYCKLGLDIPISPLQNLDNNSFHSLEGKGSLFHPEIWSASHGEDIPHNVDLTYINSAAIPEPTTILLFGAGLVGLAGFGRKKFKK